MHVQYKIDFKVIGNQLPEPLRPGTVYMNLIAQLPHSGVSTSAAEKILYVLYEQTIM